MSRHNDNPKVTQDYLDALSNLSGHRRSRLFLGQWVAAEGLIYDHWDDAVYLKERTIDDGRSVVSIDEGYTNPCSMHVYQLDGDSRMHVAEEFYQRNQLESAVVDRAKSYYEQYKPEAIIVDPAAAKLIAALADAGLPVHKANNDVFGGIQGCQERIQVAVDGLPRFTVDPKCKNWIEEITGYAWKTNRDGTKQDKPDKINDHAMDEWRYASTYFKSNGAEIKVFVL